MVWASVPFSKTVLPSPIFPKQAFSNALFPRRAFFSSRVLQTSSIKEKGVALPPSSQSPFRKLSLSSQGAPLFPCPSDNSFSIEPSEDPPTPPMSSQSYPSWYTPPRLFIEPVSSPGGKDSSQLDPLSPPSPEGNYTPFETPVFNRRNAKVSHELPSIPLFSGMNARFPNKF